MTAALGPEMRRRVAAGLADDHGGVVHRARLRGVGIDKSAVRSEIRAGRWFAHGRHTIAVTAGGLTSVALLWRAVWETGSGAALDGAAALVATGLRGYEPTMFDVSQPRNNRHHRVPGVRLHRRRHMPALVSAGVPRVRPEHAAVHGALWARSDREAALLLCLVLQQRLTTPGRLLDCWRQVLSRGSRARFVGTALIDICDGAQALGELDFARLCREVGLPQPTRQVVRRGPKGRVYLDAAWEDVGLVVEIDGGHHQWALNPVDDALRQNDLVLDGDVVLRVPVLGLRLEAARFMTQVATAHRRLVERRAA